MSAASTRSPKPPAWACRRCRCTCRCCDRPAWCVPADEDTFVRLLLSSLGTYPGYFDRLGEVNRRGPALIEPNPALAALSPTDVQVLRASGAEIIDVRSYEAYAQDWANAATGRTVQVDA